MQPANSILNADVCHFSLLGSALAFLEGGAFFVQHGYF